MFHRWSRVHHCIGPVVRPATQPYSARVTAHPTQPNWIRVGDHSDSATVLAGIRQHPPGTRDELGEVRCAIDAQVDRTFLLEVSLLSASQKLLRAVHHGRLPPKFSSNTRLTKGKLWPKKSIHSIKSSTVR